MAYKLAANTFIDDAQNVDLNSIIVSKGLFKVTHFQLAQNFGYTSGGVTDITSTSSNVIDRFPFSAATTNATDVGDLTGLYFSQTGNSASDNGYTAGTSTVAGATTAIIHSFPFAVATTNATNIGNLTVARYSGSGTSSAEYGYAGGGQQGTPIVYYNVIDKWPFAAATTGATDVGDLTVARGGGVAGQSSAGYGHSSGGFTTPADTFYNVIDRFPFAASIVNATDVGDLTVARSHAAGQSSFTHGYTSGGRLANPTPPPAYISSNVIDRFPFSAGTTNATDVGDLTAVRTSPASQQY